MTLAPFEGGLIETPSQFESEDALYNWMDSRCAGLYGKAKKAVNEWWIAVVGAVVAADAYYGYVSGRGQGSSASTPERLKDWLNNNGLQNADTVRKARAIGSAWAASAQSLEELVDNTSTEQLRIIGSTPAEEQHYLLNASLSGVTNSELKQIKRELVDSSDYKQREVLRKQKELAEREKRAKEKKNDFKVNSPEYNKLWLDIDDAKRALELAKTKANQSASVSVDDSRAPKPLDITELAAIRKEREEYAKKAEQAVEAAKQVVQTEQQKAAALEAKLKEAQSQLAASDSRIEKLKDAVAKYQDPKTVDASCLENRIQVVQSTAERWGELAVTYVNVLDQVTDQWMKVRCEKAIQTAWEQWVQIMPIDVLAKLEFLRGVRLANAEGTTDASLVTIDV